MIVAREEKHYNRTAATGTISLCEGGGHLGAFGGAFRIHAGDGGAGLGRRHLRSALGEVGGGVQPRRARGRRADGGGDHRRHGHRRQRHGGNRADGVLRRPFGLVVHAGLRHRIHRHGAILRETSADVGTHDDPRAAGEKLRRESGTRHQRRRVHGHLLQRRGHHAAGHRDPIGGARDFGLRGGGRAARPGRSLRLFRRHEKRGRGRHTQNGRALDEPRRGGNYRVQRPAFGGGLFGGLPRRRLAEPVRRGRRKRPRPSCVDDRRHPLHPDVCAGNLFREKPAGRGDGRIHGGADRDSRRTALRGRRAVHARL